MLGRRFVGWELDAEYHAIATRRLAGDEAKPRLEQPSLFGGVA
jgi:DNA modification methylase